MPPGAYGAFLGFPWGLPGASTGLPWEGFEGQDFSARAQRGPPEVENSSASALETSVENAVENAVDLRWIFLSDFDSLLTALQALKKSAAKSAGVSAR